MGWGQSCGGGVGQCGVEWVMQLWFGVGWVNVG